MVFLLITLFGETLAPPAQAEINVGGWGASYLPLLFKQ
jgi:hypothetical protein